LTIDKTPASSIDQAQAPSDTTPGATVKAQGSEEKRETEKAWWEF